MKDSLEAFFGMPVGDIPLIQLPQYEMGYVPNGTVVQTSNGIGEIIEQVRKVRPLIYNILVSGAEYLYTDRSIAPYTQQYVPCGNYQLNRDEISAFATILDQTRFLSELVFFYYGSYETSFPNSRSAWHTNQGVMLDNVSNSFNASRLRKTGTNPYDSDYLNLVPTSGYNFVVYPENIVGNPLTPDATYVLLTAYDSSMTNKPYTAAIVKNNIANLYTFKVWMSDNPSYTHIPSDAEIMHVDEYIGNVSPYLMVQGTFQDPNTITKPSDYMVYNNVYWYPNVDDSSEWHAISTLYAAKQAFFPLYNTYSTIEEAIINYKAYLDTAWVNVPYTDTMNAGFIYANNGFYNNTYTETTNGIILNMDAVAPFVHSLKIGVCGDSAELFIQKATIPGPNPPTFVDYDPENTCGTTYTLPEIRAALRLQNLYITRPSDPLISDVDYIEMQDTYLLRLLGTLNTYLTTDDGFTETVVDITHPNGDYEYLKYYTKNPMLPNQQVYWCLRYVKRPSYAPLYFLPPTVTLTIRPNAYAPSLLYFDIGDEMYYYNPNETTNLGSVFSCVKI